MTESFWSAVGGTGLVAVVFGFWLKSYIGPYLSQKAKNLATHEDIQKLIDQVRETERVKAEISDSIWDRQARWTYKRDLYARIVECLTTLLNVEAKIRATSTHEPSPEMRREWVDGISELMKLARIADYVLSQGANESLSVLIKAKNAQWDEDQIKILKGTLLALTDEARKELGF